MKIKLLAVVLSGLVLGGCGTDKNIETVQNAPSDIDSSYSNLQMLSNENFCTDLDWQSFKDTNQRMTIEATCNLGNPSESYQQLISNAKVRIDKQIKNIGKDDINRYNNDIATLEKYKTVRNAKELRDAGLGIEVSTYCKADSADDLVVMGMTRLNNPTPEQRQAEFDGVMKKCIDHFTAEVNAQKAKFAKIKSEQPLMYKAVDVAAENADKAVPNKIILTMQWSINPAGTEVSLNYAGTDTYYDDVVVDEKPIQRYPFADQAINPSNNVFTKWAKITSSSSKAIENEYLNRLTKAAIAAKEAN